MSTPIRRAAPLARLRGRSRRGLGVRAAAAALLVALVAVLSSCSQGIYSVPLPGGVDVGDNPRTYTLQFDDVLDLVPQSSVKVDGVPVGRVTKIGVAPNGWSAQVTVKVKNKIDLSDKAQAQIQQTSLLGERFVALVDPKTNASLPRQDSSEPIGVERTRTATDIEQVLGALSLLLNGGGLAQLTPIIKELNTALDGRADRARSLLNQTARLIDGLNKQKDDIVGAIDGLAQLSTRTAAQTAQIDRILDQLPAGVAVLESQRPQFVTLLQKLDKLGQVGTDILARSRDELITDLRALRPTLQALAQSAPDIITASPLLLTYPFPDALLPGVKGDSANVFLSVDLRLLNSLEALGVGQGEPRYQTVGSGPEPAVDPSNPYINGNGPRKGWPTVTLLPIPNATPGKATVKNKTGSQTKLLPKPAANTSFLTGPLSMLTGGGAGR